MAAHKNTNSQNLLASADVSLISTRRPMAPAPSGSPAAKKTAVLDLPMDEQPQLSGEAQFPAVDASPAAPDSQTNSGASPIAPVNTPPVSTPQVAGSSSLIDGSSAPSPTPEAPKQVVTVNIEELKTSPTTPVSFAVNSSVVVPVLPAAGSETGTATNTNSTASVGSSPQLTALSYLNMSDPYSDRSMTVAESIAAGLGDSATITANKLNAAILTGSVSTEQLQSDIQSFVSSLTAAGAHVVTDGTANSTTLTNGELASQQQMAATYLNMTNVFSNSTIGQAIIAGNIDANLATAFKLNAEILTGSTPPEQLQSDIQEFVSSLNLSLGVVPGAENDHPLVPPNQSNTPVNPLSATDKRIAELEAYVAGTIAQFGPDSVQAKMAEYHLFMERYLSSSATTAETTSATSSTIVAQSNTLINTAMPNSAGSLVSTSTTLTATTSTLPNNLLASSP